VAEETISGRAAFNLAFNSARNGGAAMIENVWAQFSGRRVLLLQGPFGPFFRHLARVLRCVGAASVHKVNFNGGDQLFYASGATNYRGTMEDWPQALSALVAEHQIDTVFLFGDCRPIHQCVRAIATLTGVQVWVFEEGYVRPDFVTLEPIGVNNHSYLPRDPDFYRRLPDCTLSSEVHVGNTFWHAAFWASLYYLAASVMRPFYRHYRHHRALGISEAYPWLRSMVRKWHYRFKERHYLKYLCGEASERFFLVPLQVNTDAQIRVHSRFQSIIEFIEYVVESFVQNADDNQLLVIKHHPMDRGYCNYNTLIGKLAHQHGISGRLFYIHDQHLPTLLTHACGVVTINSTVGLSAMHHSLPLAVLGEALYALPGISYQRSLDVFWKEAASFELDVDLYRRFRAYLIINTQLNGNFFRHDIFDWMNLLNSCQFHSNFISSVLRDN
jgi:capsular polysaccharide export protein